MPLIYVFGVMTCDEYYKNHPDAGLSLLQESSLGRDRCQTHPIEASTARAVALLGTSTTCFGVINLFFTGWTMKAFGVKKALLLTVFFPAVRLAIQNIGVETGAGLGILIVQCSQMITVVGGPVGYLLALNSLAAEVVEPAERTGTLGRLSGCAMFGTALGYLAGGLIGDYLGIIWPFRVTLVLFILSCVYIQLCLPDIHNEAVEAKASKSLSSFFDPIKMFAPQKWILPNGHIQKEYGVLFLGIGTFLGVLATSYIPVLLQMYSTDIFGFGTSENGLLISINSLVRGLFLTLVFPNIISSGRKWLKPRKQTDREAANLDSAESGLRKPLSPSNPRTRSPPPTTSLPNPPNPSKANLSPDPQQHQPSKQQQQQYHQAPNEPPQEQKQPEKDPKTQEEQEKEQEEESFHFDLLFTTYSLLLDSLLTALATLTTTGAQLYLIAIILPLASGTGPAAKATTMQMCPPHQRSDALSAISLVELIARLGSTSLFGLVFSGLAERGMQRWTFAVNAGVAVLGFAVCFLARFPGEGSRRFDGGGGDADGEGDRQGDRDGVGEEREPWREERERSDVA